MEQQHNPVMTSRDTVASSHDRDASGRVTQNTAQDSHKFTDTPQDAVAAFGRVGLPIKLRTAQRYCDKGDLSAIRIDPESGDRTESTTHYSWAIDPASYEPKWARMREKRERDLARQGHDTVASSHVQSRPDATDSVPVESEAENIEATTNDTIDVVALQERIKELESEVVSAQAESTGHKIVRDEIVKQSRELADKYADTKYELGKSEQRLAIAEEQLKALEAPKDSANDAGHDFANHGQRL